MLPFPKRKATSDEVELTDDDLVLVEEVASPAPARVRSAAPQPSLSSTESQSRVRAALSRPPRGAALPPGSRRVLDEQIEEDVAGQCLASIAAATSVESSRHLSSASHIRAALAAAPLPTMSPPAPSSAASSQASPQASSQASSRGSIRLPSVTAPPFVRASAYPFASDRDSRSLQGGPEAPGIRDSSPPAAFIRRSTPALAYPVSSASLPPSPAPVAATASAFGSVAPVSMTSLPQAAREPTVIVVRERPRSVWILAAAAFGAACAIAAMRFGSLNGEARVVVEPRGAVQAAALPPLPPTAVVAPVVVSAPSVPPVLASASANAVVAPPVSSVPAAGVMNFAEDQGVAIRVPSPPAPPSPASPRKPAPSVPGPPAARPAPRVPAMGPALPDGSFGLGRSDTTTATAPPSLTAPPPAPEAPRKRVLTPEQQLAEAQLKASMK